ncbi:bifunctional diaminohydroxyphosphoribosylaminopyrimidine deaminase/5-amino-6-(5-phosphoribosylamino)uracil reductase RibD [Rubinisphaera margarita]|uniref:bifunctional diaminohydroxyphosphoribosylaminopyrimidine deaminase/5-amino-6-(5-phosphoribosylamino)uracil reductase RibD n=1 Tax=Rubinisphaera margarita TaxID=2909586 RepID=UPI001EE86488|nr:bifunctional diaminohydroxyphosphoribosylaminopyrimidine deaminase/5-amino-6-(5-phosphoribosylamino)uracil reductase RibD [Rubinisphaera margarita]MCG6155997.1 bifunctional diaminohydroxyphosphoribosylaminopyrimidine deaminase/5-amino-6-(5-phosphoribosylamino)uracil reductase RibD [Rubinisphaera margarita]
MRFTTPAEVMKYALALAERGRGSVEPNPMVGAVIVDRELRRVSEGYHARFGGPHAEAMAISATNEIPPGSTIYVTLEPCAHHGKTPPCAEAIVQAGIRNVMIGSRDPARHGTISGVNVLRSAGISVETGLLADECKLLIRPFRKLKRTGLPYIHAKWAMTLDGRIATRTGSSQWISNEQSREYVHQLRGIVDAVVIGKGTAEADNPRLTARPAGPRNAMRIIFDTRATLRPDSKLFQAAEEHPVLIVCGENASVDNTARLEKAGAEIFRCPLDDEGRPDVVPVLEHLGERELTNLLVEGGAGLLGSMLDRNAIDEVHVFIAPKLVGGRNALPSIGGSGIAEMPDAIQLEQLRTDRFGDDLFVGGLIGNKSYDE